jgi:hypothetical protein
MLRDRRVVLLRNSGFFPRFIKYYEILRVENERAELSVSIVVREPSLEDREWFFSGDGFEIEGDFTSDGKEIFSVDGTGFLYGELIFEVAKSKISTLKQRMVISSKLKKIDRVEICNLESFGEINQFREDSIDNEEAVIELHVPLKDREINLLKDSSVD